MISKCTTGCAMSVLSERYPSGLAHRDRNTIKLLITTTGLLICTSAGSIASMPTSRSYKDACGIARALDVVGERWALLVVRELFLGPRRFSDLRRALPGASSNLVADRLRE